VNADLQPTVTKSLYSGNISQAQWNRAVRWLLCDRAGDYRHHWLFDE
jgi:hypothetical protein